MALWNASEVVELDLVKGGGVVRRVELVEAEGRRLLRGRILVRCCWMSVRG